MLGHGYVYVSRGQKSKLGVPPYSLSTVFFILFLYLYLFCFFEAESLTELEVTILARLARQQTSVALIFLFLPPHVLVLQVHAVIP